MFIHAPSPFQKQPQTPSQQRPSDLRDLRVNVVKQHVTVFYRNCHIKETVKGNFTHPWKESRWWKLLYFHHCSCKSDASFQPSLPKSAQGWEASLWTLLARSPNPIWLGESLCRFTKDRLVLWSHFIPESSLQHFLIPSVFFFFFMNPIIANLWWSLSFSPLPARMYLTSLFCRACCSGFGSLLWSGDEVKSPTRLAPSVAGGWYWKGNVIFGTGSSPFHFRNEEAFFPLPSPEELAIQ